MENNKFLQQVSLLLSSVFYRNKTIFIFIFLCSIIFIFYQSFLAAIDSSLDMQWYPTKLFWQGLNPYYEKLNNENTFMAQSPNYGHMLYIILYPFSFMSWEFAKYTWAYMSMILFILTLTIFYKSKISIAFILFATVFLLFGYTIKNVMGNGQMTIFIMFFTSLAWYFRRKNFFLTSFSLAIVLTKYSFGCPILLGFYLAGYRKEVFVSISLAVLSVLVFCYYFNLSFFQSLVMPLQVASSSTGIGPIDIISLSRLLGISNPILPLITILLIYLLFSFLIIKNKNKLTDDEIISLSIIFSLVTFFHLGYDHAMFLLPVMILKNKIKANNCYFGLFFLFYWYFCFGTSVLNFIGLKFPYSTNMGISYTIFFSFFILLTGFLFLLSKSMKKTVKN